MRELIPLRELIPWQPYGALSGWHSDIDDFFNQFFSSALKEKDQDRALADWLPAVETFSKDGQQIVRLDLPGVKPKEVDVSVVDDTLIIRGERKNSNEVKENDRYYKETAYGKFERRLALPKGVDGKKVKATYRNGVLEVSVPAPSKLVGTSIPIQIEHSAA